jgi:superfamily I DNA/RNA helicase
VATQDSRRIPKRLEPCVDASPGKVRVLHFTDQRREADGVANICEYLVLTKRVPPGEILILLRNDRSGTFSQPLKHALDGRQLPASVGVDPLAPLNEPEGRTFLSILRLVDNPSDNLAWRSLLEVRKNGIGTGTLMKVYQLARSHGVSFLAALELVRADPQTIEGRGPALVREIDAVRVLLKQATALLSPDLAGFSRRVAEMSIAEEPKRALVVDLVQRALDLSSATDLSELLRAVQTAIGDKEAERDPTKISIMTMHQAKGLTADAVLVVGAEDERIPGDSHGDTLDDERRLLYVSLSRARHFLYVTYCNRRTGSQSFSGNSPGLRPRSLTQFLRDAPAKPEPGAEYLESLGRLLP